MSSVGTLTCTSEGVSVSLCLALVTEELALGYHV